MNHLKSRYLLAVLFMVSLIVPALADYGIPSTYYKVMVGNSDARPLAEARLQTLQQLGFSPLDIVSTNVGDNESHSVGFGQFEFFMDAYLYKLDLQQAGYNDIEIIKRPNVEKTPLKKSNGPKRHVFNLVEPDEKLTPVTLEENDPLILETQSVLESNSTLDAYSFVLGKIATLDDTNAIKGWLCMRAAYLNYRLDDRAASQSYFQQVAEGRVAATPELRVEAMIRMARLIHARKDRVEAYRAYREIYDHAITDSQKGTAIYELAGLLMELARSDKGTLEECRQYYDHYLQTLPESFTYTRAIIGLMRLETWYHEKNYEQCLIDGAAYVQHHKDADVPQRLTATCLIFMGTANYQLENFSEAKQNFSAVVELPLKPSDTWKHIPNLKDFAMNWLIHIAEAQNDAEEVLRLNQIKAEIQ